MDEGGTASSGLRKRKIPRNRDSLFWDGGKVASRGFLQVVRREEEGGVSWYEDHSASAQEKEREDMSKTILREGGGNHTPDRLRREGGLRGESSG